MTSRELNEILLSEFPEIKTELDDYISWQDGMDTGSFLVFEDVFMIYVYSQLEKNNQDLLKRFIEFIEKIYVLHDDYATNVITVGVLENVKCSTFSDMVYNALLPETKKEYEEIQI